jgi:hypothetical protein
VSGFAEKTPKARLLGDQLAKIGFGIRFSFIGVAACFIDVLHGAPGISTLCG